MRSNKNSQALCLLASNHVAWCITKMIFSKVFYDRFLSQKRVSYLAVRASPVPTYISATNTASREKEVYTENLQTEHSSLHYTHIAYITKTYAYDHRFLTFIPPQLSSRAFHHISYRPFGFRDITCLEFRTSVSLVFLVGHSICILQFDLGTSSVWNFVPYSSLLFQWGIPIFYTPSGWDLYCSPCRLYGATYSSSPHNIPLEEVMWQVCQGGFQITSSGGFQITSLGGCVNF